MIKSTYLAIHLDANKMSPKKLGDRGNPKWTITVAGPVEEP